MRRLLIIGLALVLLIASVFVSYQKSYKQEDIEYNGVTISQEEYKSAKEAHEDYLNFDVIDLETGQRIRFNNIEKLKEVMDRWSG